MDHHHRANMNSYTTDVFISWDELHRDTRELCAHLLDKGGPWEGIIAVTRGGLIPAAIVARELDIRMVDTVCVISYQGDESQEQESAQVIKTPQVQDGGKGWIVIDDLVDTGRTARKIREILPNALFATVYAKPEGLPVTDLCIKVVPQTTWVRFPWDTARHFAVPLIKRE